MIDLRFEVDYGGVLKLDKAEAVIEYEVMEEKIVQIKPEGGSLRAEVEGRCRSSHCNPGGLESVV